MIGDVRMDRGQRFECVGLEPHVRRDGVATELEVWAFECAVCSTPGTFRRPSKSAKWEPSRRCAEHRRPGTRAAPKVISEDELFG